MRKTRNITAMILSVLMLTAALGGCSGGKSAETSASPAATAAVSAAPVQGGELTVGIAQDLDDSIDPHKMVSAGTREVLFNVFEGLLKPDTKGEMQPAVASDCKISDTGDVFTFTLRDGVKFHNGNPVTTKDVVYSLKRAAGFDTGTPLITGFDEIKSVEAPDDKTVVVTLNNAVAYWNELLAFPAFFPVREDVVADEGWCTDASTFVSNGAYKMTGWDHNSVITLTKNDHYWDAENVTMQEIKFYLSDDANNMLTNFKNGDWLLIDEVPTNEIAALKEAYPTEFVVAGQIGTYYVCWNINKTLLP